MKITAKEIEEIKKQFDRVIEYSQNILDPRTDQLFDRWYKAKSCIIDTLFDGKLIYQFEEKMSFELSDTVKEKKIQEFLNRIEDFWHNSELYNFVKEQKNGFFNNEVISDYDVGEKRIRKGTKLIKTFKFFASGKELENIQNDASRLIQENKVEGYLCLSVHPLDFLSSSENNYKWRSCHALDGEYRAGNLSYMTDTTTFMCYLKGDNEDQEILPHFPSSVPWNSKKWRTLMFISEDQNMIFSGRQYPFPLQNCLTYVLDNFIKVKLSERKTHWPWQANDKISWSSWTDTKIKDIFVGQENIKCCSDKTYIPLGDEAIALTDLVQDAAHSRHFNDVLNSSCYDPIYTFRYLDYDNEKFGLTNYHNTKFLIGGEVSCLHCGNSYIAEEGDTMLCNYCLDNLGERNYYYCDCCGTSSTLEEDFWFMEHETVCCSCIETYYTCCDKCGEYYRKEEIIYDSDNDRFLCPDCKEYMEEE